MADTFNKVLKETNAQPSQQITINAGVSAAPRWEAKVADQIMQACLNRARKRGSWAIIFNRPYNFKNLESWMHFKPISWEF